MIRFIILFLLIMPSALSLKLAVSPDVLFFGKQDIEKRFTVMNPNDHPLEVSLDAGQSNFHIGDTQATLLPHEYRQFSIYLERPLDQPYLEDVLSVMPVQKDYPLSLQLGAGIKLSALSERWVSQDPPVEEPVRIIEKEVKADSLPTGLLYSIVLLAVLAGLIVGMRFLP